MGKEKFKKGDYVINENQIKSITSLLNGSFTVEFDGSVGRIEALDGFRCGRYSYLIKCDGEIESKFEDGLILVKPEIEES